MLKIVSEYRKLKIVSELTLISKKIYTILRSNFYVYLDLCMFVDLHIAFLLVLSAIIIMFKLYLLYPHGLYSLLEF